MIIVKKRFDSLSDEDLMVQLSLGEKRAFDEIYHRYSGVLFGYFNKMLWQDKEKAQDMVHDLFAKLIVNPTAFDANRSFKTWLFTIACNMCKNEFKKIEVRKNVSNSLDQHYSLKSDDNVLNTVQDKFFKVAFDESMECLDDKHREVLSLRHLQGLSMKEIAEVLLINEGTVKSRLFYATKQLAEKLKDYQSILIET
jgi:RNA polymerase sigma-70 factor (ECF subfamily)